MEASRDLPARIAEVVGGHRQMVVSHEGRVICACSPLNFRPEDEIAWSSKHVANEVSKVVYPRIETEDQLQDVYPQSVILDADGDVYAMNEYGHAVLLTNYQGHPYEPPALPAIVLWSP